MESVFHCSSYPPDAWAQHRQDACFALLDDVESSMAARTSRLYTGFEREQRCDDPAALDGFWVQVEEAMSRGLHALVLADYEWGARLQGLGGAEGSLRVLLYRDLVFLSADEVDAWLAALEHGHLASEAPSPGEAAVLGIRASVDRAAFDSAIECIHRAIADGETYQVNYSYRLDFEVFGSPVSLYRRLRARQPVRYGALLSLPEGEGPRHVLSCSPELFVEQRGGVLRTRPMKGTAPRSGDDAVDDRRAERLRSDPKNRAENLMIVDLLRNDIGRIARTGSVHVPALFSVESYRTVLQMTSTVEAEPASGLSFSDVLRALFPCGSITGAPKLQTMRHIQHLETRPRGLYTGAIGWVEPGHNGRMGDFCLSVPIRTLLLQAADEEGRCRGELGIGAGIVIDSTADEEYAECELKASFLTGLDPGLALFESLYVTRQAGVRQRGRHLARLAESAQALGFRYCAETIERRLDAVCAGLETDQPQRLRLVLHRDGLVELTAVPLDALPAGPVQVRLAASPLSPITGLMRHKTTWRAPYDAALREAQSLGAFDMLFYDEADRLTEGARSNVFLRLDGQWLTPALSGGGILPGTMRAALLEDPAWQASEARLTVADLRRAERILLTNALRGAIEAVLVEGS